MHGDDHELELVVKAVDGDRISLQKLLVAKTCVLSRYAATRLPVSVREQVGPEDIVQETFIRAFRSIGRFCPEKPGSFQSWLSGIADHVVKDAVKRCRRDKRGGQFHRVHRAEPAASGSDTDLVELLSAGINSPSHSVIGHEAVEAVQEAMAALPEDYRQAVQLRLLDGKSLEEAAEMMNRPPPRGPGARRSGKEKNARHSGELVQLQIDGDGVDQSLEIWPRSDPCATPLNPQMRSDKSAFVR